MEQPARNRDAGRSQRRNIGRSHRVIKADHERGERQCGELIGVDGVRELRGLDRRLTRREFVSGSLASAATFFGHAGIGNARQGAPVRIGDAGTVFHVHGFHAAPDRGGGRRIDLQIDDMRNLAATSVTVILPTEEYVGKAAEGRLLVVTRLHFDNFDEIARVVERQLAIHEGLQAPLFQVGNEIDQEKFGGVNLSPERFVREVFLPVVSATRDRGGKILIPPMGPGSPTEFAYLDTLVRAIKVLIPPDVIRESLGVCIHNYFYEGQDPLERVRRIYQQTRNVLGSLPIYITEAGLNQNRARFYPDDVIRDETLRYGRMPVGDLPIAVNNWWVIGNRVFRGPPLPEHVTLYEDFETNAWRKEADTITPVYAAVSHLAQQMRAGSRVAASIR